MCTELVSIQVGRPVAILLETNEIDQMSMDLFYKDLLTYSVPKIIIGEDAINIDQLVELAIAKATDERNIQKDDPQIKSGINSLTISLVKTLNNIFDSYRLFNDNSIILDTSVNVDEKDTGSYKMIFVGYTEPELYQTS